MSEWSLSEYEEYDDFLIKKWKIRGWDPDDAVYVVKKLKTPADLYVNSL